MTKQISVLKIIPSTTVDGPGLRTSIYSAGCANMCPGCHNPQSWDIESGHLMDIEEILDVIMDEDFCDVTFSGGDPMFQAESFAELARQIKAKTSKNIWCYTGYTVEQVMADPRRRHLLEQVDVLVDGRFVRELRDETLLFRGSSNQRLIDARETLRQGKAVIYELEKMIEPVF